MANNLLTISADGRPVYLHEDLTVLCQAFDWAAYSRCFVLVDTHTATHCYPFLREILPADHQLISVQAGELHKTLDTCQYIWQRLTAAKADRRALLLNLGGGVLGDMGGFCAATYKRGIAFVQMPTTLLSQVDASVGGKLGIDFDGLKNHIGLFAHPEAVLVSPLFLKTLPANELRSGFAEIIKHCLIADAAAWERLQAHTELGTLPWMELIAHSVRIKAEVVAQDPREQGLRKILNFGHTIGHALETQALHSPQPLLHGEAVAIGMWAEGFVSKQRGLLSEEAFGQVDQALRCWYPSQQLSEEGIRQALPLMLHDKKNSRQTIMATLLDGIGKAIYDQPLTIEEAQQALEAYVALGK